MLPSLHLSHLYRPAMGRDIKSFIPGYWDNATPNYLTIRDQTHGSTTIVARKMGKLVTRLRMADFQMQLMY